MAEQAPGIEIEVACALPDRQRVLKLRVSPGTTAREAFRASGIAAEFPEIDAATIALGVYGRPVRDDYAVQPGDRVECYRPLAIDPREARRRLVEATQRVEASGTSRRTSRTRAPSPGPSK